MDILNYLKVNEWIQTSGQPSREQFSLLYESGVKTVVNLMLPNHEKAIHDEGALVSSYGMNYIHIPVIWDAPQKEQYLLFEQVMQAHLNKPIWVHCALNWRVSCFIYLFRAKVLQDRPEDIDNSLNQVWQPNEIWSDFMREMLS